VSGRPLPQTALVSRADPQGYGVAPNFLSSCVKSHREVI
jgi:hypothetical protein